MLGVGDFTGVQTAVDVDDRRGVPRQAPGFLLAQPFGMGEALGDAANLVEPRQIRGRGDDRQVPIPAEGSAADALQPDTIARRSQPLKVADRLLVGRQEEIIADPSPQDRFRRRNPRLCGSGQRQHQTEREHGGQRTEITADGSHAGLLRARKRPKASRDRPAPAQGLVEDQELVSPDSKPSAKIGTCSSKPLIEKHL